MVVDSKELLVEIERLNDIASELSDMGDLDEEQVYYLCKVFRHYLREHAGLSDEDDIKSESIKLGLDKLHT